MIISINLTTCNQSFNPFKSVKMYFYIDHLVIRRENTRLLFDKASILVIEIANEGHRKFQSNNWKRNFLTNDDLT